MKKALLSGLMLLVFTLLTGFTSESNYSVVNKSGVNVTKISISPTGDSQSTTTISRSISKDQTVTLDIALNPEVCQYDIKFTDESGNEYSMSGVELCESRIIVLESNKEDSAPKMER